MSTFYIQSMAVTRGKLVCLLMDSSPLWNFCNMYCIGVASQFLLV